jgi:hypothetical protein
MQPEDNRFNDIQKLIFEIEKEYANCTQEEILKATQTALAESQFLSIEELKQKIKSYLSWDSS